MYCVAAHNGLFGPKGQDYAASLPAAMHLAVRRHAEVALHEEARTDIIWNGSPIAQVRTSPPSRAEDRVDYLICTTYPHLFTGVEQRGTASGHSFAVLALRS